MARCDAKTGHHHDDVVMLWFSGASLARAVVSAQAESPKEHQQLDSWQAGRFVEELTRGPSDQDAVSPTNKLAEIRTPPGRP